ncbi:hypothetical protein D3OALGB2SA_1129 [Olavius algarvensis associated proteobacterium Delta 3]|nr:hypothetical protein D3OALGB2SA_1129 [Olavius algarvensis associated proteobacterium Delta 3]
MMGLFRDEHQAVSAVESLTDSPFKIEKVHSPIPSHRLSHALKLKKSRVGWYTLVGGIIGFFSGFALASFTALRWELIVGGKPVVALVPFLIVGFEFTVLFAVFGNIIGFLFQADLPRFDWSTHYDERLSGDQYGILATCDPAQQEDLEDLLTEQGAEVRAFAS